MCHPVFIAHQHAECDIVMAYPSHLSNVLEINPKCRALTVAEQSRSYACPAKNLCLLHVDSYARWTAHWRLRADAKGSDTLSLWESQWMQKRYKGPVLALAGWR